MQQQQQKLSVHNGILKHHLRRIKHE
jgi:hypothetical protein